MRRIKTVQFIYIFKRVGLMNQAPTQESNPCRNNQAPTINLDFMNQSLQNQAVGLINKTPSYRVYSEKSIKSPAIVGNFKPFWSNFGVIIH
jgi:hypothetical protein